MRSEPIKFFEQRNDDYLHVFRALYEFMEGFSTLNDIKGVTVFGSAREPEGNKYYAQAQQLAKLLADKNIPILTGGGPGVMEAANRGAKDGTSIGLNIVLPYEQNGNKYINKEVTFENFFVRKHMFIEHSTVFVTYPGGFGTLDELTETLTLMQTRKIEKRPIILSGSEFWAGLIDWIKSQLIGMKYIDDVDTDLIVMFDTPEEIAEYIFTYYKAKGIKY